jgi:uncharacterized membrane protein YphA (DoxX/SURF4 family)
MKKLLTSAMVLSGIRIFLGVLFLTAGIAKQVPGFPQLMGPPWLIEALAKYDLALFARFIAYSQILIGWLLLTKRFATIGAVMLLPMLLNILMVTISQHWTGTPYVVSVFLALNVWLLAADYHKLKFLLTEETGSLKPIPIVRISLTSDKLILAALMFLFAGPAFGETNKALALILIGTGFFLGLFMPVILNLNQKRRSMPVAALKNDGQETV